MDKECKGPSIDRSVHYIDQESIRGLGLPIVAVSFDAASLIIGEGEEEMSR